MAYSQKLPTSPESRALRVLVATLKENNYAKLVEEPMNACYNKIGVDAGDVWNTPYWIVEAVAAQFEVDVSWIYDLCPLKHDFDELIDADALDGFFNTCNWMNPPFSRKKDFILQCLYEFIQKDRSFAILLPKWRDANAFLDAYFEGLGVKNPLSKVKFGGASEGSIFENELYIFQTPAHLDWKMYNRRRTKGDHARIQGQTDFSKPRQDNSD